MPRTYVGTSGWVYQHWKGLFYAEDCPQRRWLECYAETFDTVELNSTFYHTPALSAVEGWYRRTPLGFLFVVKGSRFVTHTKRLADCAEALSRQQERLAPLREKHGPILWQLPPSLQADSALLTDFLALKPPGQRWAFEFRHPSWFTESLYALLRAHNCCLVWADSSRYPLEKAVTADFLYARFHGYQRLYATDYTDADLERWSDELQAAAEGKRDLFAYFNNDYNAYAPKNALKLRELLGKRGQVLFSGTPEDST
jgi:uncharacterized protein YecE (DUF72 family)